MRTKRITLLDHDDNETPASRSEPATDSTALEPANIDSDDGKALGGDLPSQPIDDFALHQQQQRLLEKMFGHPAQPQQLQHYELLEELGRGGMGVVYAAHDQKLDRRVAIKVMAARHDREFRFRFEREAKAMAKLAHPNVVQVYEIGESQRSTFIAMEYVEGVTLRTWLAKQSRSRAEILETFLAAGRGLAAAHDVGLVHRDFKPDNVMVRVDGRVLVMDFGLASNDLTANWSGHGTNEIAGTLTGTGTVMGTPVYMAPEQWAGAKVTAQADQFSFCVALWEALYRERPFNDTDRETLAHAVRHGALRQPKRARVPQWLRQVLERGLAVEPARRFESMHALLDALASDPIARLRRGVAVMVLTATLLTLGMLLLGKDNDLSRAREATTQRRDIDATATSTAEGLAPFGHDWALFEAIERADRFGLYAAQQLGPEFATPTSAVIKALLAASAVETMWGTRLELRGHVGQVFDVEWSPDDTLVVTAGDDHTVRVWEASSGEPSYEPLVHEARVHTVRFSPDGVLLATASDDQSVRIWHVRSGKLVHRIDDCTGALAFTPTGNLLTAHDDGTARIWKPASGRLLVEFEGHEGEILSVAVAPDGDRVATADDDGSVKLWETATGRLIHDLPGHEGEVTSIAFSPDGALLATGSKDRTAALWHAESGERLHVLDEQHCEINSVAFSPAGGQLLTACVRVAQIWDIETGAQLRSLNDSIVEASYSSDGQWVLTANYGGAAIWDPNTGARAHVIDLREDVDENALLPVSYSHDDRQIVIAGQLGKVEIWAPSTGRPNRQSIAGHPGDSSRIDFAAFSHDGTRLATADSRTLRVWRTSNMELLFQWHAVDHPIIGVTATREHEFSVTTSSSGSPRSFGPDGVSEFWVNGDRDGEIVKISDPESNRVIHDLTGIAHQPTLAISRDDEMLAIANCWNPSVEIRSAATHDLSGMIFTKGSTTVERVALSQDGRRSLTIGGSVQISDTHTYEKLHQLEQANGFSAIFSPDGRLAITVELSGSVAIFDAATGHPLGRRDALRDDCTRRSPTIAVGFSEDGRDLLTLTAGGVIDRQPINPLLHACRRISSTLLRRDVAFTCARARVFERSGFVHTPSLELDRDQRRLDIGLWLLLAATHILIPAMFLVTGMAASLRNWAANSTVRTPMVVAAWMSPCVVVSVVARNPPTTLAEIGVYLTLAVDILIQLAVVTLACLALLWLIRRQAQRWWLWLGLALATTTSVAALTRPFALVWALQSHGSLLPPALEMLLYPLADLAGAETSRGFAAHLDAHASAHHAALASVGFGVGIVLALLVVHLLWRRCVARFGHRLGFERLDVVTLPLLLALFHLVALMLLPVAATGLRHLEREADLDALEQSHDNLGCATAAVVEGRRETEALPSYLSWELAQRPVEARIDLCNLYRPWEPRQAHFYDIAVEIAEAW